MRERRTRRLKESLINRRVLKGEKKSSKWWSDPTKLIPIVISSAALFISFLSWQESHQGRLINEEINRPIFTLENITSSPIWGPSSINNEGYLSVFSMKIKNFGKVSANIEQINLRAYGVSSKCDLTIEEDTTFTKIIMPGFVENFITFINIPKTCDLLLSLGFYLSIEFKYSDSATGKQYVQHFGEFIILNTKTPFSSPTPTPTE
jgi:hypothetical protein